MFIVKMHRLHVRMVAALVVMAVAAATSPQGYCLMKRASPAQGPGAQGAHACCAQGIGTAPPACCHADTAVGPKAVLGSKAIAIVFASTLATWTSPVFTRDGERAVPDVTHRPHSPPLTILRI